MTSRRAQRRDRQPDPIPNTIQVPRGHPWSCPTCAVEVVQTGKVVGLVHDDDCATWQAPIITLREFTANDYAAFKALTQRW